MKGAMADPVDNTIMTPNKRRMIIIGNSQNFLRTRKNAQRSLKNSMRIVFSRLIGMFNVFR
jgi:hypothetical protein